MPIYIALLGGINVGGHKQVKMEKLTQSFEALGFKQTQTYIQSGNVVFTAAKTSPATLSKKIEEKIGRDFGFPVPVVVRTQEELAESIKKNPFLKKCDDGARLHLTFFTEAPSPDGLKELENLTTLPDESCCLGREIYLYLPNGMGKSSLNNNPVERRWFKGATTRNWNTVVKLLEMCRACK
jgi:uncharacterized protein (DUF1697 family)